MKKNVVFINVTGGVVQEVISKEPLTYILIDEDTDGVDQEDSRVKNLKDIDGGGYVCLRHRGRC